MLVNVNEARTNSAVEVVWQYLSWSRTNCVPCNLLNLFFKKKGQVNHEFKLSTVFLLVIQGKKNFSFIGWRDKWLSAIVVFFGGGRGGGGGVAGRRWEASEIGIPLGQKRTARIKIPPGTLAIYWKLTFQSNDKFADGTR